MVGGGGGGGNVAILELQCCYFKTSTEGKQRQLVLCCEVTNIQIKLAT